MLFQSSEKKTDFNFSKVHSLTIDQSIHGRENDGDVVKRRI